MEATSSTTRKPCESESAANQKLRRLRKCFTELTDDYWVRCKNFRACDYTNVSKFADNSRSGSLRVHTSLEAAIAWDNALPEKEKGRNVKSYAEAQISMNNPQNVHQFHLWNEWITNGGKDGDKTRHKMDDQHEETLNAINGLRDAIGDRAPKTYAEAKTLSKKLLAEEAAERLAAKKRKDEDPVHQRKLQENAAKKAKKAAEAEALEEEERLKIAKKKEDAKKKRQETLEKKKKEAYEIELLTKGAMAAELTAVPVNASVDDLYDARKRLKAQLDEQDALLEIRIKAKEIEVNNQIAEDKYFNVGVPRGFCSKNESSEEPLSGGATASTDVAPKPTEDDDAKDDEAEADDAKDDDGSESSSMEEELTRQSNEDAEDFEDE